MTAETSLQKTLLVHIPFFYNSARLDYLRQVLSTFFKYQLVRVSIVVDTNHDENLLDTLALQAPSHVDLQVCAWKCLEHPFLLTWMHRKAMQIEVENYDYFLYVEDDIQICWTTFLSWTQRQAQVKGRVIVGFLRCEKSVSGAWVASDWQNPLYRPSVLRYKGKRYVRPHVPYMGLWLYDRKLMRRFINSSAWSNWLDSELGIRESAAIGFVKRSHYSHRLILPLSDDDVLDRDFIVHHLPNNYALNPSSSYATLTLEELIVWDR